MKQRNDSTLKLCSTRPCYCVGAECLPDDAFADVGGNEEGDSRPQTVSLLKQLIQADDDDASEEQLHDIKPQACFEICQISASMSYIAKAQGLSVMWIEWLIHSQAATCALCLVYAILRRFWHGMQPY